MQRDLAGPFTLWRLMGDTMAAYPFKPFLTEQETVVEPGWCKQGSGSGVFPHSGAG